MNSLQYNQAELFTEWPSWIVHWVTLNLTENRMAFNLFKLSKGSPNPAELSIVYLLTYNLAELTKGWLLT